MVQIDWGELSHEESCHYEYITVQYHYTNVFLLQQLLQIKTLRHLSIQ